MSADPVLSTFLANLHQKPKGAPKAIEVNDGRHHVELIECERDAEQPRREPVSRDAMAAEIAAEVLTESPPPDLSTGAILYLLMQAAKKGYAAGMCDGNRHGYANGLKDGAIVARTVDAAVRARE